MQPVLNTGPYTQRHKDDEILPYVNILHVLHEYMTTRPRFKKEAWLKNYSFSQSKMFHKVSNKAVSFYLLPEVIK